MSLVSAAGLFRDQAYVVGPLFALSGASKLLASRAEIDRTAFAELVRKVGSERLTRRLRSLWLGLAGGELAAAALLLSHVSPRVAGAAVAGLGVGFTLFVAWVLRTQRGSSCGCFGTGTPATWRSLARAALVTALAATYATTGRGDDPTAAPGVLVALGIEVGAILALSSELRAWLRRAQLAFARATRSLGIVTTDVSAVRRRIEKQEFWNELVEMTKNVPEFRSAWRDDRWYVVEYHLDWDGRNLTVVGCEYIGVNPPWVRFVVAEEGTEHDATVLASWDSVASAQVAAMRAHVEGPTSLDLVAGSA
jgi:hypothetical protein